MSESVQETSFDNICEAIVKSTIRATPENTEEVRRLVLHIDEPAFRYTEGQNIGVLVPGPHAFGNKYHHRRYSIANSRNSTDGNAAEDGIDVEILVRRCFYIDEISGERYPGVASNYLCDAKPGDKITISGPYRSPFRMPRDDSSNMLMIGTGTGVAPFRAFIQYIYGSRGGWKGKVRLFYGDRNGMDLLYLNDAESDLSQYYDEVSFKAFQAVIDRPLKVSADGLEDALSSNMDEALTLMREPNTYVFLAGRDKTANVLNKLMVEAFGSEEAWQAHKQGMVEAGRWSEMLYQ